MVKVFIAGHRGMVGSAISRRLALNNVEVVDGEGVIGKKPVIKPGESYTYSSGCLLSSPIGAMKGYFNMVNFTSTRSFRVMIPTFKLSATFAIN